MAKETKDQNDKDVREALNNGKELPSGTVLRFYGKRADDVGVGAEGGAATGDDGNTGSTATGTTAPARRRQ
jgi:hypothetical protein